MSKINRQQRRALAQMQTSNAKQLTRERQEIQKQEKEMFLKLPWYRRLGLFYKKLPTTRAKVVFFILSPVVFGVFLPIHFIISLLKIDVAWTWAGQILYSFKNGK